jgi:hypothetical protein
MLSPLSMSMFADILTMQLQHLAAKDTRVGFGDKNIKDVGYIYSYLHPDFVEIVVVRHGETTWNSLKKCQVQFYFIFKNLLQFCSLEFSSRLCYSIFNIIILTYINRDNWILN